MITVARRFHRSVSLDRDWSSSNALDGYVRSPLVLDCARRISEDLFRGSCRAWALVGPYGSGKSAFALFIANLVAHPASRDASEMVPGVGGGGSKSASVSKNVPPLVPVLLTGERAALGPALLRALGGAVKGVCLPRRLSALLKQLPEKGGAKGSEVVDAFVEAAGVVKKAGMGGLFVVIDELGKFLEHASMADSKSDVFLLQQLAEAAAREPNGGLSVLTILHQSFGAYAQRLSVADQAEWQKVAGRFEEISFLEPMEQVVATLGTAIQADADQDKRLRRQHLRRCAALTKLIRRRRSDRLGQALESCYPIDPIIALLLASVFRGSLAQNHRALFSFLTSKEAGGFQAYLERADHPEELYGTDDLYDYVTCLLATQPRTRRGERVWALSEAAIETLDASERGAEIRLVKAIALLERFGGDVGLGPELPILAHAIDVEPDEISRLASDLRAYVVPRRFSGSYHLWSGSDVDIDSLLSEAEQNVRNAGGISRALSRHVVLRPIIGGRHLNNTGAMRWLEPHLIEDDEIGNPILPSSPVNGVILYVIPRSEEARSELVRRLSDDSDRHRILAHPASVVVVANSQWELHDRATRMLALDSALRSVQSTEGEPAARRELAIQLADAKSEMMSTLAGYFGWSGRSAVATGAHWFTYRDGPIETPTSPSWLASSLFDDVFLQAPRIHNELLNRDRLSTSAARARRDLLELMIDRGEEPHLGLQGHPPELAMYRAVLLQTGVHRPSSDSIPWGEPTDREFLAVWREFLSHVERQDRPLALGAVYDRLQQPPFGVTRGLLPVLTVAILLTHPDRVSLFENGSLILAIDSAVAERLQRRPDDFSVRAFPADEARLDYLRALEGIVTPGRTSASVLPLVKALVRMYRALPGYSLQTSTVTSEAKRLRGLLASARDPQGLIFDLLPEALGFQRGAIESAGEVAKALDGALHSLRDAFPDLKRRIRSGIHAEFDVKSDRELVERARELPEQGLTSDMASLRSRILKQPIEDGWAESIATLLAQRAPEGWNDDVFELFKMRLRESGRRFRSFERLTDSPRAGQMRLELTLVSSDGRSASMTGIVPPGSSEEVQSLTRTLIEALPHGYTRRTKLAAVTELLNALLAEEDGGEESSWEAASDMSSDSPAERTARPLPSTSGTASRK